MQSRRLQRVGRSTLVVSVPKSWIECKGLKPGDVVTFTEEEDGSLKVSPSESEWEKQPRWVIEAGRVVEKGLLSETILVGYIKGMGTMEVLHPAGLSKEHAKEIQDSLSLATGLQIVEQNAEHTLLQVLVNPRTISSSNVFRLVQATLSSLGSSVIRCISESGTGGGDDASRISLSDEEFGRLRPLLLRALGARPLGDFSGRPWNLVSSLAIETVTKIVKLYVRCLELLSELPMVGGFAWREYLKRDGERTVRLLDSAMKAFVEGDHRLAAKVLSDRRGVEVPVPELMESACQPLIHEVNQVILGVGRVMGCFLAIRSLARDLAEKAVWKALGDQVRIGNLPGGH